MLQAALTEDCLLDDAYLYSFDATVRAVYPCDEGVALVLDRTAFFPEGGGQSSDVGTVAGFAVTDVQSTARGVEHTVRAQPTAFSVGQTVHGEVDRARRFDAMQCHTAEHILSGLIHTHYGLDNVGFHLGREEMTMDISGVLDEAALDRIEHLANRAVYENVPVTVSYPTEEQLATLPYRAKLPLSGRVRIVTVKGVDICACCAPHVAFTGEIGLIKLLAAEKHRGGMRLYVAAGERAFLHVQREHRELHRSSTLLSVHPTELSAAIGCVQEELKRTSLLYKSTLCEHMRALGERFSSEDENPVVCFPDTPTEAVRAFLNAARGRVRGVLVALTPRAAGGFDFLLASDSTDLRAHIATVRDALSGRGGGSAQMMQGSLGADEDAIRDFFKSTKFVNN